MVSEDKLYLIAVALFIIGVFGIAAYRTYNKSDCARVYAPTNRTADEITKICRG